MGIVPFDCQIMLVAYLRRIAAMARHLLGQELSAIGYRLELVLDLIAVPACRPQMANRCLSKRHCHAVSHLFQPITDILGPREFFLERVHRFGLTRQSQFLLQRHEMENAPHPVHDQLSIKPTRALRLAPKPALSAPFCCISSINCGHSLTARSRSTSCPGV